MNRKFVFNITGYLLEALSVIFFLPIAVSVIYKEYNIVLSFLIAAAISFLIGFILRKLCRTANKVIYAKEGFVIVALAWISTSLIGALPFTISGEIPSYIDAFFETVSGFTTTGASILPNVESMSKGLLFWRSFTNFIGGMGVLVFVLAFVSNISDRSIHIMRAEMPGPIVGKIMPRVKETSKVLYIMYIVLTVIEIILLICGGMPIFDSFVHAFSTAGTGGFGIKSDSIASYSPYLQWVIGIFMVLFGINFNVFYLITIKRFKTAFKSSEMWTYFGIIAVSSILIIINTSGLYSSLHKAVRDSFFQVSSIMTSTGYATVNFDTWPMFSKSILFILMFIGACAGSTGGGIKVSRFVIVFKLIAKELKRLVHPRSVSSVKFEGKEIDSSTQNSVVTYFSVYIVLFFIIFVLLCLEPGFNLETNISATAACFNNTGPGFAAVGPAMSYAGYSDFSKILLSFTMLLGRLEIFPILITFIPSTWNSHK